MNIEQIKCLTARDFGKRNSEVWSAIEKLSLDEVSDLINYWDDGVINAGLNEIVQEKSEELIEREIIVNLTPAQKMAVRYAFQNESQLWNTFRLWSERGLFN